MSVLNGIVDAPYGALHEKLMKYHFKTYKDYILAPRKMAVDIEYNKEGCNPLRRLGAHLKRDHYQTEDEQLRRILGSSLESCGTVSPLHKIEDVQGLPSEHQKLPFSY